jgi:hypothetical protein
MNTPIPTIEAVKALDGMIFAMLDDEQMEVLNFYRDQGRKFGVSVSIINEADPEELARARTKQQTDQVLKGANSRVSVAILTFIGRKVGSPEIFTAEAETKYTDTDGNMRFDKP